MTSTQASQAREADKRRGTRVTVSIAIIVAGIDALGEPFREATTTTEVSCYGCKYRTKNYVHKGSSVAVEIPQTESTSTLRLARGRVVWVQRPRRLREPYEVALEFEVAGNIWGIPSPPRDWFPHPDEPKPEIIEPSEPGVPAQAVLEIGGGNEPEPSGAMQAASTIVAGDDESRLAAVEEMTFTLGSLSVPGERPAAETLSGLASRVVVAALEPVARQTTERILSVISEAQDTSRMTAEALEDVLRQLLERAADGQVRGLAGPPKRRKRSKRNKSTSDGSAGKQD